MVKVKLKDHENYKEALARIIIELGQPTRQKILDLLFEGLKVGDICDRLEIETVIVSQVICDNIESHSYSFIKSEAK